MRAYDPGSNPDQSEGDDTAYYLCRVGWWTFAAIDVGYKFYWDVVHDWGLGALQNKGLRPRLHVVRNQHKKRGHHRSHHEQGAGGRAVKEEVEELRPNAANHMYPEPVYYLICFLNLLLRLSSPLLVTSALLDSGSTHPSAHPSSHCGGGDDDKDDGTLRDDDVSSSPSAFPLVLACVLVVLEVFRRGLWNLLRLEYRHLAHQRERCARQTSRLEHFKKRCPQALWRAYDNDDDDDDEDGARDHHHDPLSSSVASMHLDEDEHSSDPYAAALSSLLKPRGRKGSPRGGSVVPATIDDDVEMTKAATTSPLAAPALPTTTTTSLSGAPLSSPGAAPRPPPMTAAKAKHYLSVLQTELPPFLSDEWLTVKMQAHGLGGVVNDICGSVNAGGHSSDHGGGGSGSSDSSSDSSSGPGSPFSSPLSSSMLSPASPDRGAGGGGGSGGAGGGCGSSSSGFRAADPDDDDFRSNPKSQPSRRRQRHRQHRPSFLVRAWASAPDLVALSESQAATAATAAAAAAAAGGVGPGAGAAADTVAEAAAKGPEAVTLSSLLEEGTLRCSFDDSAGGGGPSALAAAAAALTVDDEDDERTEDGGVEDL
jgi:hypothetical protein